MTAAPVVVGSTHAEDFVDSPLDAMKSVMFAWGLR